MRLRLLSSVVVSLSLLAACGGGERAGPEASAIGTIELSQRTLTLGVGSTAALEVKVLDAKGEPLPAGSVFWSTSDPSVALVSSAGVITAVAEGTAKIAATIQGRSAVAALTVAPTPAAAVSLTPTELRLTTGAQGSFTAQVVDAAGQRLSGRIVTWRSGNAGVAIIDSTGRVTAVAPGATSISATSEGRSATGTVIVSAVAVASIQLTPTSATLVEGQTTQLTAEARDAAGGTLAGRVITWMSSAPAVASVSSAGQVVAISAGSATITATSEGRSATSAITVTQRPVSSVIASPSQVSMQVGQTARLTVQVTDAQGGILTNRPVSFSSANTGIATVASDGTITAVGVGSTTITVSSSGRSTTVNVVVAQVPAASIRVSPATASLFVGENATLTATVLDAAGRTLTQPVSWSSGAPSIATVAQDGSVTAVGIGSAVILASADGRVGSATVTVSAVPVASVSISPATVTLDPQQTATLTATVLSTTGSTLTDRAVLWTSSAPTIATVSTTGVVTAVGSGDATITASADGQSGTARISVTKPVAVNVGRVEVSPTTAALKWSGPSNRLVKLTATAYTSSTGGTPIPNATFTWTTSNPNVAVVAPDGTVTAIGDGTATITATSGSRQGTAIITSSKK